MTFALLGLGLLLGLFARHARVLPSAASDWINGLIINIALPAMILLRVPAIELNREALIPMALAWCVILASAASVAWLGRVFRWPREILGAMLLVVPLSNTAYLGLPLIDALCEPAVLPYAILYDQIGNFMGVAIYASVVVALLGSDSDAVSVSGIAKRVFLFPPFLSAVIALALPPDAVPVTVLPVLQWLATAMGPMAMFLLGVQLETTVPAPMRRAVVVGGGIKLLAAPALVVGLAVVFDLRGPAVAGTLLQSAMPPMITAGLIGIAAGFSRAVIVALTGVASVASIATLPVAFYLATWLGY
jgi:predicted permease